MKLILHEGRHYNCQFPGNGAKHAKLDSGFRERERKNVDSSWSSTEEGGAEGEWGWERMGLCPPYPTEVTVSEN